MKNFLLIWLGLTCGSLFAQDLKEASSDKAAVLEGHLRDAKPAIETKMADGTSVSIWLISSRKADGSSESLIAKACAKSSVPQANEGIRTITVDFNYDNGKIQGVQYNETLVIQNPTPSVSTKKKEFLFTDGVQTSPSPGSLPDLELFVNNCLTQINSALQNHVNTR